MQFTGPWEGPSFDGLQPRAAMAAWSQAAEVAPGPPRSTGPLASLAGPRAASPGQSNNAEMAITAQAGHSLHEDVLASAASEDPAESGLSA
eukprot:5048792-Pyramimonas_sp.AAC.1